MPANIRLHGKNIEITPALRRYVERKLGRLERYFDEALQVQVTMEVERDNHVVEVTVPVAGFILRGEEASPDMYASVDLVWDKLERQIHKYKTRLHRKPRREGAAARSPAAGPAREPAAGTAEVVRVKRFPIKPMTLEEAILQVELLGHDFFVFRDAASEEIHVVYRRREGGYGVIEPGP
ncbi:MAG: ribosome-associated translation inhibitor RaiA [Clostridia bacterium]|nr:ribosome-associated translation inhibitor RaiA [Clostridia bacterium]